MGETYKLIKTKVNYLLEDCDKVVIASTSLKKTSLALSKQNCDELFGIVDVEKWAKEHVDMDPNLEIGTSEYQNAQVDFKAGFNKKAELDKDKLFTAEEMKKGMSFAKDFINWQIKDEEMIAKYGFSCSKLNVDNSEDVFIQSLQQPKEIEVEIVMEEITEIYRDGTNKSVSVTKFDSNGCLILKKIKDGKEI
jgi:hypothetical protein